MWYLIGTIIFCCACFYFYFGHSVVILFWKCMKHDVKISYFELAKMKKDKVNIEKLLKYAIRLKEQGDYDVKIREMMLHELSGGDLSNVVKLLLTAKKKNTDLAFYQAAIIDLEEINKKKKLISQASRAASSTTTAQGTETKETTSEQKN